MTNKELQEFKARVQQAHHYRWHIAKAGECATTLIEMGATVPNGGQPLTPGYLLQMIAEVEASHKPRQKVSLPPPPVTKPDLPVVESIPAPAPVQEAAAPKIDPHDTSELDEMLDVLGAAADFKDT